MEFILTKSGSVEWAAVRPTTSVDAHVGSRIRLRRITLGMSARYLGEQIGASFQQVFNYEKGKDKISASQLYRIAVALGEPVEFFFGNLISGQTRDGKVAEDPLVSEVARLFSNGTPSQADALDLVRCYLGIRSVEKRHAVLHLIRVLGPADEK
jgi:transcriptional regulator with XRE-family HTH domain